MLLSCFEIMKSEEKCGFYIKKYCGSEERGRGLGLFKFMNYSHF